MKQWCYAISSSFVQPYVKPLLQINENKQQQKKSQTHSIPRRADVKFFFPSTSRALRSILF